MIDWFNANIEGFIKWYENSPPLIQLVIGVILIKNILLRWVSDEVRKFIFEPIGKYVRTQIIEGKKDRSLIIREHVYAGHIAKLGECQEDSCALLSSVK